MCRIVVWIFTFLYVAALALLLIGTFGLFGNERDPLSAMFLLLLGLPWTFLVDLAPEPALRFDSWLNCSKQVSKINSR